MAHHHHRHGAPSEGLEHLADPLRIIPRTVGDILAADISLLGFDDPFVPIPVNAGHRAEPLDPASRLARTLGQSLCELRRVNVTVERVPHSACKVVRFHERVVLLQLFRRTDVHLQPLIPTHRSHFLELLHPLLGMRQPDRAGDVIVHRIVDILAQRTVHRGRITLHVHHGPRAGKVRNITRCVPGGTCGQFVLFKQNTIRPTGFCQMVQCGCADDAAPDDNNARCCWKISHFQFSLCGTPSAIS